MSLLHDIGKRAILSGPTYHDAKYPSDFVADRIGLQFRAVFDARIRTLFFANPSVELVTDLSRSLVELDQPGRARAALALITLGPPSPLIRE